MFQLDIYLIIHQSFHLSLLKKVFALKQDSTVCEMCMLSSGVTPFVDDSLFLFCYSVFCWTRWPDELLSLAFGNTKEIMALESLLETHYTSVR